MITGVVFRSGFRPAKSSRGSKQSGIVVCGVGVDASEGRGSRRSGGMHMRMQSEIVVALSLLLTTERP